MGMVASLSINKNNNRFLAIGTSLPKEMDAAITLHWSCRAYMLAICGWWKLANFLRLCHHVRCMGLMVISNVMKAVIQFDARTPRCAHFIKCIISQS